MNDTEYTAYREAEGISSSILAAFIDAPDVALMDREPKGYFEEGRAFERLLQDYMTGSSLFADRFFVADCSGSMPDDLIAWIESGEDLAQKYGYNKDGITLNGTKKTLHGFLDECIKNPGKVPITADQHSMLDRMVNNLLDCRLSLYSNDEGLTIRDLLIDAQYQVPVYWEFMGMKKKALFDVVTSVQIDGENHLLPIDLKTTAALGKFRGDYFSRYWVQDCHYSEGIKSLGQSYHSMPFAVASKCKPFLAQCFRVRDDRQDDYMARYNDACLRFAEWTANGRPACGWKTTTELY